MGDRGRGPTRPARDLPGAARASGAVPIPLRMPWRILRPKGHLSRRTLAWLAALAVVPLISVALRLLALPGVLEAELGPLRAIGQGLEQGLSLNAVPAGQRDHVLYLLLLPTCALLVAVARLTLGFRVLGFRSILIAVGFHESGIVPSLLLITVAVAAIVLMRPWMRRIHLPYYARVSVILCVVATTMAGALLAGPWMRADLLWGMAYFPVIVLGMLAEGIARTLDRDNVVTASWRAITTIALAFVIALVCWIPALRSLMLQFPELVLSQIVMIVLVSEYLDLRMLQGWDLKVAARLAPRLRRGVRVAIVCDPPAGAEAMHTRRRAGPGPAGAFARALRRRGHLVRVLPADETLPGQLRRFLATGPAAGADDRMAIDLTTAGSGPQGAPQVPALLELMGIPYVGQTPHGHAVACDRAASRLLLEHAGVPALPLRVLSRPREADDDLPYPATVVPRHVPGARPRPVRDRHELRAAVRRVMRRYGQQAVVEPITAGREISACLVGTRAVECLPLVELDREHGVKRCPAALDAPLAERIAACARAAFRACGCRDFARVDLRVEPAGQFSVLAVRTRGVLARRGAFVLAAAEAGWSFDLLVHRIVESARAREGQKGSADRDGLRAGQRSPAMASISRMPRSRSRGGTIKLTTR